MSLLTKSTKSVQPQSTQLKVHVHLTKSTCAPANDRRGILCPRKGKSLTIFTARNSSCGKVMFSQAYVKNSVHEGHAWDTPHPRRNACPPPPPGTKPPCGYYEMQSMSRRYVSYWNAFFLSECFIKAATTALFTKCNNLGRSSPQWLLPFTA